MNENMKYLRVSVLLFALHHVRANDVITNQLEIHCKATRFLFRRNGEQNNVKWDKEEVQEGLRSWNQIATVEPKRPITPENIAPDWRGRARVTITTKNPGTDDWGREFYTVDSFLTIDNVKKDDGGQYRCGYTRLPGGGPPSRRQTSRRQTSSFTVTILDAKFNRSSREIAIQEGENLVIIPSLRAVAISRKWKRPWNDEPQYSNELIVNRIRHNQNGTYTFSYTIGGRNGVVYSEFFYITVNTRPTTQTTTTTNSIPNITRPPPLETTVPDANPPQTTRKTLTTAPPLTSMSQIPSVTHIPGTPIIATSRRSSKNENTSPRSSIEILPPLTTPNISIFMSTSDQNESVTPALQTGEVKDIETPTLVGIIFGTVLGTIILIVILILILGRKGKLPHFCRKKTAPRRETSRKILANKLRESGTENSAFYSEIGDPDDTYTNLDLTSHDIRKMTPDMKVKMTKQDAPNTQKNEYNTLSFATETDKEGKQSLENGYQGLCFGGDNQGMYEDAPGYACGGLDYFKLEELPDPNSSSTQKFAYATDNQADASAYFVLEEKPEMGSDANYFVLEDKTQMGSDANYFVLEEKPQMGSDANYFVLEETPQMGNDDPVFSFENGANGMPQGESETGVYFVLEDNV